MFDLIDSQEEIVLAKLSNLLEKYSRDVIIENTDGQNLLRCCGLSSLLRKYEQYLNPYYYRNGFKYKDDNFNPGLCINNICLEISSNKKILGLFLKEFLSRITEIREDDLENFQNYLEVLGYKLNIQEINNYAYKTYSYSLAPYTEGIIQRQNDVSYLTNILTTNYNELVTYYEDAISTYGNSEYKSCIESCRTLIDKLFSKLDNDNNDFTKGVLKATKEEVPLFSQETPKLSQKGIFEYWIKERKGFNRYRLFITMYSLMSGLGTHGEEIPTKQDALLCLRISEDILLWYFQNNKEPTM